VLVALVLVTFAEGTVLAVVPTVVAGIGKLFGESPGPLNWVSAVQLLATGVCTPVLCRLGDMYGHRRLLRLAVLLAAIGATLAAVAPTFALLLVGRALEGPIGAFTPLAIGILRDRLDAERLRIGIGVVVAGLTAGSAIGLILAAQIYRTAGTVRGVLWIPAGCLIAGCVAMFSLVPETRPRTAARMDWVGAIALTTGLGLLLLALAKGAAWGWTSGRTTLLFVVSVTSLVGWILFELRTTQPLIDLRSVGRRVVAPFYLASFTIGVAFFGASTATTTFLASNAQQDGYGFTLNIAQISYVLLPNTVSFILGALVVVPLARLLSHKSILYCGFISLALGYATISIWHAGLWQLIVANSIAGLGTGVVTGAMPIVLTERANRTTVAISTGMFITGRAVGGSIAGAAFAAVLTSIAIPRTSIPRPSAYIIVWASCGAAALASLLIVVFATNGTEIVDRQDQLSA
jgi:MFS family permease